MLISLAVFCLFVTIYRRMDPEDEWIEIVQTGCGAAFIAGMLIVLASLIFSPVASESYEMQLYSLDRSMDHSHGFLGASSAGGHPVFCYYTKCGGAFHLNWVRASKVRIYEDGLKKLIHTPTVICWSWWTWVSIRVHPSRSFEFHIPEGSIRHTFNP